MTTTPLESELQTDIANVFIRAGLMTMRFNSGGAKAEDIATGRLMYIPFYRVLGIASKGKERKIESGLSDLTAAADGRIVYVEVKRPNEDLRTSQKTFQAICNHFNMPYEVARSVDDAMAIVRKYWPDRAA